MSQQSCTACNDLREYAPAFVQNGVTDSVCNNLSKNKGLSNASGHDDCDDLHDINDCLIGNMDDELDAFDVCEIKDFLHQYIPNNYETLKALICSMCGQWDRMDDMCQLISNMMQPPYKRVGTLPYHENPAYRCGTINKKNGNPLMIPIANPHPSGTEQHELWNHTCNVGIMYSKLKVNSCDTGACKMYEWIYPSTHHYQISQYAEPDDVLWYVSKSALQSVCGFSDALWHTFDVSSWTWKETPITQGSCFGKYLWINATVNPGGMGNSYFGLVVTGTSFPTPPNNTPITKDPLKDNAAYDARVADMTPAPRTYINACD